MKYYLIKNDIINETTTDEPEWLREKIKTWKETFKIGGRAITIEDDKKSLILAPEDLTGSGLTEITREEADNLIQERIPERESEYEIPDEKTGKAILIKEIIPCGKIEDFENRYLGYGQNHSGIINADETWTLANSPHHITAQITTNAKITVEPGCDVQFDGFFNILNNAAGWFYAVGTSAARTTIRGNINRKAGYWNYISIAQAGAKISLEYCDIKNATMPIYLANTTHTITFKNNFVENCVYLIRMATTTGGGNITFENCYITNIASTTTGGSTNTGTLTFKKTTFDDNRFLYGFTTSPAMILLFQNCKFLDTVSSITTYSQTLYFEDCLWFIAGELSIPYTTGNWIKRTIFRNHTGIKFYFSGDALIQNCDIIETWTNSQTYAVQLGGGLENCFIAGNYYAANDNIDLTPDAGTDDGIMDTSSTSTPPQFSNVDYVLGMRATPNFQFIPTAIVISGITENQAQIDWAVDFTTEHRIRIGTAPGVYDTIIEKDYTWSNYLNTGLLVTKTPQFILKSLKPRTKYYILIETWNYNYERWQAAAEQNFTTTEYYLLPELEVYNNKVRYSSTAGEVMQINGQIKTDYATTAATVKVEIRKKSDDSLVATIFSGPVNFAANIAKTLTQINGGIQMTWTTAVAAEYYVQLTVTGGTPTISTDIENQVEAEFEYFRSDDVIILNQQASNYAISEATATEFSCNLTNATGGFVIVNGKIFDLIYDPATTKWKRTVYGYQVGVCATKTIYFYGYNDYFITDASAPATLTVTIMANYDIAAIETQIVAILSAITDLKSVLDYEPKIIPQLPAVTLFYDGYTQSQTEAVSFTIQHKWIMRLYVRLDDAKKAQDDLKSLTKQILQKFKQKIDLNGVVYFSITPSATVGAVLDKNNPVLIVEFDLTASKEEV